MMVPGSSLSKVMTKKKMRSLKTKKIQRAIMMMKKNLKVKVTTLMTSVMRKAVT